jgi:hypothetical protein
MRAVERRITETCWHIHLAVVLEREFWEDNKHILHGVMS